MADLLSPAAIPSASTSGVIQGLSTLVTRFLLAAVPALSAPSKKSPDAARPLDTLLGNLVTSTLLPLLPAFHALSRAHLTALFRPGKGKAQANHDARPDALAFLHATLHTLADLARTQSGRPSPSALLASAHAAVVRAGVRELEALYAPAAAYGDAPPPRRPASGEKQRQRQDDARVEKLARRDALWYLCAVLHAAIPGAALDAGGTSAALREGVCTALAGLLRPRAGDEDGEGAMGGGPVGDRRGGRVQCPGRRGRGLLGGVEREMLLAVAEKVWLSQG